MKNQNMTATRQALKHNRVAGGITGENSFAYLILLLRGLFRVEMFCEFVVIVAAASFLQENRAKHDETMQNDGKMRVLIEIHAKINEIFKFCFVFNAFCEIILQNLSYSEKIPRSFGEIIENKGNC